MGRRKTPSSDASVLQMEKVAAAQRTALLGDLVQARKAKGLSQTQLGEMSGFCRSAVARVETEEADPPVSSLLQLLIPLEKTLAIVPLEERRQEEED